MLFDNANQIARIRSRWRAYTRIATRAIRSGVSPYGLLASRFPHRFPTRSRPASLSVEFTDACNLKCDYCTNPTFAFPRSYLSDSDAESLLAQLDEWPVERIRVCGGEPTLHPRFDDLAADLARRCRFLSIVTNAQWRRPDVADVLVGTFDLVEISIDAGGREVYETARAGASYERLCRNVELLHRRREELRSTRSGAPATINIRLMVRPTTVDSVEDERRRWATVSDCVMVQHVIDQRADGSSADVFVPVQLHSRAIPRCTMPFKDLAVRSDGTVPVCHVNGTHLDPDRRIVLGDLATGSLAELWSGPVTTEVRDAHRARDEGPLDFCRSCSGR